MAAAELVEVINRPYIAITRLIFDTRITMQSPSFGRQLITGVPHYCQTVGGFKEYLVTKYLQESSRIKLYVDTFYIPDDENSKIFVLLHERIRVVPGEHLFNTSPTPPIRTPASTIFSRILENRNFPDSNYTILSSQDSNSKRIKFQPMESSTPIWVTGASKSGKKFKYNSNSNSVSKKEQESTVSDTDFDQIEPPHKKSTQLNITIPVTFESDTRPACSSKRRHRFSKSMNRKIVAGNKVVSIVPSIYTIVLKPGDKELVPALNKKIIEKEKVTHMKKPVLDSTCTDKVTPENKKINPVLIPFFRKQNARNVTHTPKSNSDNCMDSFEVLKKSNTMSVLSLRTSRIKRKEPPTVLMRTLPCKFEKHISLPRTMKHIDEDTPRISKRVKNPVAYDILKSFEIF